MFCWTNSSSRCLLRGRQNSRLIYYFSYNVVHNIFLNMDHNNLIECGGFYFIHNFDSGNLGHVERVPTELIASTLNSKTNNVDTPDYEFNLWTRPDCAGTEFENGNRTWFYFGVQPREAGVTVRLNLINLNKQGKMYNQGMAPVTRTLPGKPQWERIRDRPIHSLDDNTFTLSFKYRTCDNLKATTFFAFTYPFSFAELQIALNSIDLKMLPLPSPQTPDDIYYCRECLTYSLEGRRVDLLTISSHHGITKTREERLKHLFPEQQERPYKFTGKKVIFISARVHPGETPSSFVFNGFLNLLLTRHDPIALALRKLYVFKMIPFLNPDGVARGHYRTDTRGVNLNRVYLNPSLLYHPTVYASRALIRYHHFGCEKEDTFEDSKSFTSRSIQNINESVELLDPKKKKISSASHKGKSISGTKSSSTTIKQASTADNSKQSGSSLKPPNKEATQLAEQVCDLNLRVDSSESGEASQATPQDSRENDNSLLDDNTLRSCLGSNVHLSTSEELNFQGPNPLRPLRDALKNSITLLMESNAASAESSAGNESLLKAGATKLRMGWCHDCRRSAARLHDAALAVPAVGSFAEPSNSATSPTYRTIDEYRKHQKEQLDEKIRDSHLYYLTETERDAPSVDSVYFCTNCFKRYIVTENNEEIKLEETVSTASVAVSAGDSGDIRSPPGASPRAGSGTVGDSAEPMPPPPPKEDKAALRHKKKPPASAPPRAPREPDSGLYLYIDLHGHASKKGIFMYGNHFEDMDSSIECMLLPRIMSLNNLHFHFSSCNFTERNMYLKDRRDGMSREGSGRVAVLKATGLVRSYTLECNYNTGRLVNVLPPPVRDAPAPPPAAPPVPPKYTPHIFEEVGRSLGASILDLTAQHPNSRVPCSEHRNLSAVREWLRAHTRTMRPQLTMSRLRPKTSSPTRAPLYARSKGKVVDERKENTYVGAKADERRRSPGARAEPGAAPRAERSRYLEPDKPKPLAGKRRNVLAVRKPNASKTTLASKGKPGRRSADDTESPRPSMLSTKLSSKRSFSRSLRSAARVSSNRCRAMASSSSDDTVGWEEAAPAPALGRRRPFPTPPPARLKKIRLKTGA